mmetsp:Transcript_4657/g.13093  ORF Transcript_4657/g.13093 Transcript_4657/m.13093 type:complete len:778 (-) Transcript_4657:81-2414(-)
MSLVHGIVNRSKSSRHSSSRDLDLSQVHGNPAPVDHARSRNTAWARLIDWVLGTTVGQWMFLLAWGAVLILSGSFAWYMTPGHAEFPSSTLYECMWMSYTLWADVGTQTGLPPDASGKCAFVVMLFSFCGFVYNLALLGLVVDVIRGQLAHWKWTRSRVAMHGHILILGWCDKTLYLLNELIATSVNCGDRPGGWCCPWRRSQLRVVVLASRSALEMKQDAQTYLLPKQDSAFLSCITYRQGDAADQAELLKVSAPSARSILLMSASQGGSDDQTMQTLLALAALQVESPMEGNVFAEMQNHQSLMVMQDIFPGARGIIARHAVNRMLILRALVPSVGFAFMELVTFNRGSELYIRPVPKELEGVPFAIACRLFPHAILCGVMTKTKEAMGDVPSLIPSEGHLLEAGESLVMVATGLQQAEALDPWDKGTELEQRVAQDGYNFDDLVMADGQLKLGPSAAGPKIVIVLGCPSDFPDFLDVLDCYLADGSMVHMLSERSRADRMEDLRRHFAIAEAGDETTKTFKRIDVVHYFGSTTSKWAIKQLPLSSADCALILSESQTKNEALIAVDSRTLTSVITLRSLMPKDKTRKKCKVVTELVHPKSQQVLNGNSSIRRHGSFVYSTSLETAVFSLASHDTSGYRTLTHILNPESHTGHIMVADSGGFVRGTEQLSYLDLHTRVFRASRGILLGWRRKDSQYPVLNPPDKRLTLEWRQNTGDELIVFSPAMSQKGAPDGQRKSTSDGQSVSCEAAHAAACLYTQCQPPGCIESRSPTPAGV